MSASPGFVSVDEVYNPLEFTKRAVILVVWSLGQQCIYLFLVTGPSGLLRSVRRTLRLGAQLGACHVTSGLAFRKFW